MNVEKWISDGWHFAKSWERVGAVMLFGLVSFCLLMLVLLGTAGGQYIASVFLAAVTRSASPSPAGIAPAAIAVSGVLFLGLFLLIWLARGLLDITLVNAAREFTAKKKVPLAASFNSGKKRFAAYIVAAIAAAFASAAVSLALDLIPAVGWLLSAVAVGMLFAFWQYYFVLAGKGAADSITSGVGLALKKPLQVFVAWLCEIIIVMLTVVIAAVIAIIILVAGGLGSTASALALVIAFAAVGLLALAVLSAVMVFAIGYKASAFRELANVR